MPHPPARPAPPGSAALYDAAAYARAKSADLQTRAEFAAECNRLLRERRRHLLDESRRLLLQRHHIATGRALPA